MRNSVDVVSRLQGFSDGVFAFALTLLVVSLDVPNDFRQLLTLMKGFAGFGLMFAMVCWIWYEHAYFYSKFGSGDPLSVFLNSVLLFVVLFYVYPLKFLTAALMGMALGLPGPRIDTEANSTILMVLYSTGVVLIFGIFALMYRHSRRARARSADEELTLQYGQRAHTISMAIGLVSILMALLIAAPVAGLVYILMGPLHAWNGYTAGRARETLPASPSPQPPNAQKPDKLETLS